MAIKSSDISSEYIITLADDLHEEYTGDLPDNSQAVPFRFAAVGPFNIRKQPVDNHYKTFLGEQKA
jgi:hypothetical protein